MINPININLKELFIYKGFKNYESGQQNVATKKNANRWQSIEDKHDNIDFLSKVGIEYEPISLLSTSQFGETYLVKIKSEKKDKKKKSNPDETQEKPPAEIVEEYHILKIIDKSKFLKKEKAFVMRQVRAMMHVDHPTISCYTHFFMSSDFFYFLSKLRLKVG
jgi:serine/threonine protein kinase